MNHHIAARQATVNPKRQWVLFAMALGFTMTMIDATIVSVALPSIQKDLALTSVERAWVINAYLLVLAVFIAAAGRFSDVFGQKRVFMSGVVIFTVASAFCGAAANGTILLVFRAIEGFGAALMTPTSQAIVTNAFPTNERGRALGIYAGVSSAGVALGPILGGILTGFFSWRLIFYVNLPVGIATILLTLYANPVERRGQGTIDWPGLSMLVIGLSAFIIALMQSSVWGITSPLFLSMLGLGIVFLALFVVLELRIKEPLINLRLFQNRNFLGDNLIMFIIRFALFGMAVYTPIFVQEVLGFSPQLAGFASIPATLMLLLLSPRAGKLYDQHGIRPLATWGMILACIGYLWFALIGLPQLSYWWLVPAYILVGSGIALNTSPTMTDLMNSAPAEAKGEAAGILGTTQQLGGTVGIAVLTALITPLTYNALTANLAARGVQLTSAQIQSALASYDLARQVPPGITPQDIVALQMAFTLALSIAMLLIATLLLVGLIIARTVVKNVHYEQSSEPVIGA